MPRRSPSRWLAPLAILVVAGTSLAIVNAGGSSGGGDSTTATKKTTTTSTTARPVTRSKTYVVKSGDTLSAISIKTGVSISRIQALNPNVDVQALQPKQRLKLRR